MNTSIIKTEGLQYRYSKNAQALFDINIDVQQGNIYGFLGPNGSGKTTTLSLLLGLLKPTAGHIEIFGQELQANRINILKKIGSLVESPSLYGHLNAKDNLNIYAGVYAASKSRVDEVLKIVGLQDAAGKTVKKFSLGMKQRLAIALALLPKPELLVLDEPANGLDPAGIIELRELVKKLNREEGMTIIISSHILAEVEKMVSHLGIIVHGRMLFQGTPGGLVQQNSLISTLQLKTSDNEQAMRILQEYLPERNGECLSLAFNEVREVAWINKALVENGIEVYLLQPEQQNLEKLFIELTKASS